MTFASRLEFLTVEFETPPVGDCVPVDSLNFSGSCLPVHARLDLSLAIFSNRLLTLFLLVFVLYFILTLSLQTLFSSRYLLATLPRQFVQIS